MDKSTDLEAKLLAAFETHYLVPEDDHAFDRAALLAGLRAVADVALNDREAVLAAEGSE